MFCYDINPNKDWQKHFYFSIALRVDRFHVQSINRKLPPSSTSMRKSRRNARAHCSFEKRLLPLWERLLGFKRSPSSDVTDGGRGARPPWQAKCKKWAPVLVCISVFNILLIFSSFLFFCVSQKFLGVVSGNSGCEYRGIQLIAQLIYQDFLHVFNRNM